MVRNPRRGRSLTLTPCSEPQMMCLSARPAWSAQITWTRLPRSSTSMPLICAWAPWACAQVHSAAPGRQQCMACYRVCMGSLSLLLFFVFLFGCFLLWAALLWRHVSPSDTCGGNLEQSCRRKELPTQTDFSVEMLLCRHHCECSLGEEVSPNR